MSPLVFFITKNETKPRSKVEAKAKKMFFFRQKNQSTNVDQKKLVMSLTLNDWRIG